MLSKVVSSASNNLVQQSKAAFSVKRTVMDLAYKDDTSCPHFQATHLSPREPLVGHTARTVQDKKMEWNSTKLSNGVTVLSESSNVPGPVNMGVLLNVGTRDEDVSTSGALLSIKNTYLKTVMNTNETINYGVVQMSGGNFEMNYNQETALFQAQCLAHDAVDVFSMVADCAVEPKSVLASQVGQSKNQDTHKLDQYLKTGEHFHEAVFSTAFGGPKGLGLPLKGLKGNVGNLTSYTLQKFQLENITPERVLVAATGVDSHSEFVQLVQQKLSFLPAVDGKSTKKREASSWVGGEVRNLTESNRMDMGLFFQGVNWSSADVAAVNVLTTLMNTQRLQNNLLNKHHYVDCAEALNFSFSDNGLWGLRVSGSSANGKQMLDNTVAELKSLASKVSAEELNAAKSALQTSVGMALERQSDRLEEGLKNWNSYGQVKFNNYASDISKVTADQVSKAVATMLKSNPTFVVEGNNANSLPSFDQVKNSLK